MNILYTYISVLILTSSLLGQSTNDVKQSDNESLKLIISLNAFHNAKVEDAKAIAQILANHIKKAHNLDYNFIVETPETISDIERVSADNFDFIILTTEEYVTLQKKLPLEPFVTNYSSGHIGYKYYFIVHKDEDINDISQLKDETLNTLSRVNQKAAYLWLDKLLRNKGLPNHNKFFKDLHEDYKATNVVLPVFFKKSKAGIVTEVSFNLLTELNPALKEKIKILYSSDYLLLGIGCLNSKNKNTSSYKVLSEIIPTLHTNEYGKQLLHLFNADKLVPYKDEYLQNYLKLNK